MGVDFIVAGMGMAKTLLVKIFLTVAALVLVGLQAQLWIGEGSLAHVWKLEADIDVQAGKNNKLKQRNQDLESEVLALKKGYDGIEGKARMDLGMIKEGETFYLIVNENKSTSKQ